MHRRQFAFLLLDLALVTVAALVSFALRENFNVADADYLSFLPYLCLLILSSALVFSALELPRSIWRFSGLSEYLRITMAVVLSVAVTTAVLFISNRMEGIARSLPLLQIVVATALMVGSRVAMRMRYHKREMRRHNVSQFDQDLEAPPTNVLLVGLTGAAQSYLSIVSELAPTRVKVAGFLGRSEKHIGRLMNNYKVLGTPEDAERVIEDLNNHGILINTVIVAMPFTSLTDAAKEALRRIEKSGSVEVSFLADLLVTKSTTDEIVDKPDSTDSATFQFSEESLQHLEKRPYWRIKRTIDIFFAALLLIIMLPLGLAVAGAVAVAIGSPILFWQVRPGLGGRPFKLYKFRTMLPPHDFRSGYRRRDEERETSLGRWLRRSRLDELPQLWNILNGDMSFVGPRPLLPVDQSSRDAARLLVRPGLTGLAQTAGGRSLGATDKAAFDVWYIVNANLWLDLKILFKTLIVMLRGETAASSEQISSIWRDLEMFTGSPVDANGGGKGGNGYHGVA